MCWLTAWLNFSKARDNADLDRCVDGGSLGILKVDLSQRKRHSDGKDNDDKSHKSPIRGLGLFFAVILPLQIGHRDASLLHSIEDYILAHTLGRLIDPSEN